MGRQKPTLKAVAIFLIILFVVCGAAYLLFFRDDKVSSKDGNDEDEEKNRVPMANSGPSQIVRPGEAALLNGTGSSDPDGDELGYYWDIDSGTDSNNDGVFDNDRDAVGAKVEHFYPVPQTTTTYLVTLNVSDGKLWDKATTRVTIMVSVNNTPPEVVMSCRYGKVPGGSPLDPYFMVTVVSVSSVEMISNFSYRLDSPASGTISQGNVSDLLIAPPGSDIRFVDIIPVTRLGQNDIFYFREGQTIKEGCTFKLLYLGVTDPVGEIELSKTPSY
ncbi:MAG: PKD domain-containing protein [Candidatus Thermoplasmatota archaeon]|jgi:hypothetical protein|nr:PKD domain-containing protein [Candidatus Thermoplasmatota archaeon]